MKKIGVFSALTLAVFAAFADVTPEVRLSSAATIDHGHEWQRLPTDGGFRFSVCGHTTTAGGRKVYHFDNPDGGEEVLGPCDVCEPGAWAAAPVTCASRWKTKRGL